MTDKKKKGVISKIVLICFAALIALLIAFIFVSTYYLSPVDKKNDKIVEFKVESGSSKNSIANNLEEAGLIRNSLFFKIYIRLNSDTELYAGTYNLSKSMSAEEIIEELHSNNSLENETITVTFIEGKRLTDYVKKIADSFEFNEEEVLTFIDSDEFVKKMIDKYWFITDDVLNDKLYHPLEGYLFADTYEYKKSSTMEEVIDKMIYTMGQKLNTYKEEAELSDLSLHELLTLASIVELEGANSSDRAGVAGVFYNRINNGWYLGSDVTTYYGVNKDFSRDLSMNNLKNCNPYNTSSRSSCAFLGLPIGPIASPSLDSIHAVIEPVKSDYYYFVADKNKKTYYSKTEGEHNRTVSKLKSEGLWYEYN